VGVGNMHKTGGQGMRYRITFVSRFQKTVEANNADEARTIANELAIGHLAFAGSGEAIECDWNTIEPLDSSGD
jgi:hypothetical protein